VNRGLRIGLIVVVVLALAYPAAAWVIGMSVQHNLQERERVALAQVPYLKVVKSDYRRGIYSSTEEITYQLVGNWLQGLPGGVANGGQPFQITVRNHIHHGPLPQMQAFAPATVDTEFALAPDLEQKIREFVGDQAHLTIHSQLKWSGGATTAIHSTPFKKDIPNVGTLEWRGLDGKGDSGSELGSGAGEFSMPGLIGTTPKGNFAIEDVKVSSDLHPAFGRLAVGKIGFSVGHLAATTSAAPDFKLDSHNLTLQADTAVVSGDFLNTDVTFAVDSLEVPKFAATQLVWEMRMSHFYGPETAALNQAVMEVQSEQLQASQPSDPNSPAAVQQRMEMGQKILAAFQTHGLQILGRQPIIELPRIGFKTPDGDLMLSLKLEAPGITPADLSADPKTLALALPKFLQATVNARIDSSLLDKLLQQAMPEPDQSNEVKARLQQLQGVGYIKVDGKALVTQITYVGGQLKINGQQFNPAALAPPQQPQQPPPGLKSRAPKTKRPAH
jgi:uncharacterized protein YdgA (DUF945 family)